AFADIPTSHSPAPDVPAAFFAEMDGLDPDVAGRFTAGESWGLLRSRLRRPRLPGIAVRDLAFAWLDTLGLSRPGWRWREPRVKNLMQAGRMIALCCGGDAGDLVRARAWAMACLERSRTAAVADGGQGSSGP